MQSPSDFEKDIKANALQKPASFATTSILPSTATMATTATIPSTTVSTASRIALTKTTFLTPIQNSQKTQHQQQQQKPLYTTLTAKQTTTAGSITTTNLGKVVIKDLKGIIKPIITKQQSTTTIPTTAPVTINSPLTVASSTPLITGGVGETGANLNVAIVAAKRPQLTIVATKSNLVADKTFSTVATTTSSVPTTTNTLASVVTNVPTTVTTNVIYIFMLRIL